VQGGRGGEGERGRGAGGGGAREGADLDGPPRCLLNA
jgi:hypothetical protein